jgi:hypothetical protein
MTDQPADYAAATIRGVLTDLQRIAGEPAEPAQSSEIERLASVLDSLSAELAEAASALRSQEAGQLTMEEILDRASGRSSGSVPLQDAVAAIRDDRDRR